MYTTSATLLVRLRKLDDQPAWSLFVQLYTPLLYYWARKLGNSETDAAELVQELLVTLVQKLPEFQYEAQAGRSGRFRAWLRKVAVNKWRDLQKRKRPSALPPSDDAFADLAQPDDAEAIWEREYQQFLVARALEVMKAEFQPTTWQACWETAVKGRKASDVSRQLGISQGAVFVAKSKVLRRLREVLAGLWEDA